MAGSPCGDPPPAVAGTRSKSTTEGMVLGVAAVTVMGGLAVYAVVQLVQEASRKPRRRREWDT